MAMATVLAVAALALMGGSASAAPKGVVNMFGAAGTTGGLFTTPRGVAVNQATGDVYVVDSGNHRIQQFNSTGSFIRTWGQDVDSTTAGTGFEICPSTDTCKKGLATATAANGGDMNAPQGVAIDQSDGSVYVTDQGNRRVQKFDSSGNFISAFGWDVITDGAATGDPGNVVTFQTCTIAANCKTGVAGAGAGQFGTSIGYPAVEPLTGYVYVADPANRRVQKFDSSGNFSSAFGWGVDTGATQLETCTTVSVCQIGLSGNGSGEFGSSSPTRVAVDSAGFIYTVDLGNSRVQKFAPSGGSSAVFAATALSVDAGFPPPVDVVLDPVGDHVFVTTQTSSFEAQVVELDFGGNVLDTHGKGGPLPGLPGNGLPPTNGLAVDGTSGNLYLSASSGNRVFVLNTVVQPTATTTSASSVTATGATLNGTVNPQNGFQTGYHFEYSADGASWVKAPNTEVDAGTGNADVPVSQAVTGLKPNTDYHVRLVVRRPFGGGSATSSEGTFTTNTTPPTVSNTYSSFIGDTEANIGGDVNPQHSATTYRFEYGTDTSYGTVVPVPDGQAGSGSSNKIVNRVITGLTPGKTYHFRLVATNVAGETAGPDATFTTRATAPVADGRVYEMVSPPDKNGHNVAHQRNTVVSSVTGNAVAFASNGAFANQVGSSVNVEYLSVREADGWSTFGIGPPGEPTSLNLGLQPLYQGFSDDLSVGVFKNSPGELVPGANPIFNLYVRDNRDILEHQTNANPSYTLLTQGSTFPISPPTFAAATPDGSHIVFEAVDQLTPDAQLFSLNVYEYVAAAPAGSQIRFVGILPDGSSAPSSAAGPASSFAFEPGLRDDPAGAISDDGRRIFFTAPADGSGNLYMRVDGTSTVWISKSEATVPDPSPKPAVLRGALADGSKVWFTSTEKLVDADINAAADLYRYDVNANSGNHLTLLSEDGEPADGSGADVQGVLGVSDDGTAVYFVSTSQIVSGAPTAPAAKLYLWKDDGTATGAVRYLGGLRLQDANVWGTNSTFSNSVGGPKDVNVTPDGRYILFPATAQLTSYDNEGLFHQYLYDAGTGTMSCPDCPAGEPSGAQPAQGMPGGTVTPNHATRRLSDDGRVFFQSPEALLPADVNGRQDVYEYDHGVLSLVSTGTGNADAYMADSSPSGDDVFIITREALVPQDQDHNTDLYDARVGGGFGATKVPPAACSGDDCQGPPSGVPSLTDPASPSAGVSGNIPPAPRPSFSLRALTNSQKSALVATGNTTISVRVTVAGEVTVSARARIGRQTRTVARGSKTAVRAGTVRVAITLSRGARKQLAKRGTLRLSLSAGFSKVTGHKTLSLTLRRSAAPTRSSRAARRATAPVIQNGR